LSLEGVKPHLQHFPVRRPARGAQLGLGFGQRQLQSGTLPLPLALFRREVFPRCRLAASLILLPANGQSAGSNRLAASKVTAIRRSS